MKALSQDLRARILAVHLAEKPSQEELARRFSVHRSTVRRLLQRHKETGGLKPKPRGGGYPGKVHEAEADYLRTLLMDRPDMILAELCQAFQEKFDRTLSLPSMCRNLQKLKLSRKKDHLRQRKTR